MNERIRQRLNRLLAEDPITRYLRRQLERRERRFVRQLLIRVVVEELRAAGCSGIPEACERFGVSRHTVYRAIKNTSTR